MDKGNVFEGSLLWICGEFTDEHSRTGGEGAIPEGGQTSDLPIFNLNEPGGRDPAAV